MSRMPCHCCLLCSVTSQALTILDVEHVVVLMSLEPHALPSTSVVFGCAKPRCLGFRAWCCAQNHCFAVVSSVSFASAFVSTWSVLLLMAFQSLQYLIALMQQVSVFVRLRCFPIAKEPHAVPLLSVVFGHQPSLDKFGCCACCCAHESWASCLTIDFCCAGLC